MAHIPTVTMWNEQGRALTVNAGDKALQEQLRKQGYELEETIRAQLPEEAADMAMEDIIAQLRTGKIIPPPKQPEEPKHPSPPDSTPDGDAAQDQAAGDTIPEDLAGPAPEDPKPAKRGGKK